MISGRSFGSRGPCRRISGRARASGWEMLGLDPAHDPGLTASGSDSYPDSMLGVIYPKPWVTSLASTQLAIRQRHPDPADAVSGRRSRTQRPARRRPGLAVPPCPSTGPPRQAGHHHRHHNQRRHHVRTAKATYASTPTATLPRQKRVIQAEPEGGLDVAFRPRPSPVAFISVASSTLCCSCSLVAEMK